MDELDKESYTDDWYDGTKEKKKQASESSDTSKDQEESEMDDLVNAHNYDDQIQA
jgi:hypothetical protein